MISVRWCLVVVLSGWFGSGTGILAGQTPSVDSLLKQANAMYRQQPEKALKLFDKVQRIARQQGRSDFAANSRVDEATVYYAMYDAYSKATTVCRAGLQLSPLADSTRFKLWASLGEMYHQRARTDSLTWFWQRADELLITRPSLEREARAYVAAFWGNRGTAYFEQGDYRLAERCFRKRLLLLAGKQGSSLAIAENQFAYFYLKTGQPIRADSLFRASLQHSPALDLTRGWLLLGLIECRLQRQHSDSVPGLVREATDIVRRVQPGNTELMAYLHQATGQYWVLRKQLTVGLRFFKQSLDASIQLGNASRLSWRNLMAMSRLAQQQNQIPKALSFAQRAVQIASLRFQNLDVSQNPAPTDFLNGPDLFESLCWKAHLFYLTQSNTNHLALANQTYDRAFALSAILQASYSSDLTKLFVQNKLRSAYCEAVAIAYARYRRSPTPVLLSALLCRQEQGNASVLRETLQVLQNPFPNAPPQLLEQLQQAKARLSAAKTAFSDQARNGQRNVAEAELVNAELAWSRAYARLQRFLPEVQPRANEATRLQSRLNNQMAFLQYSFTPDSLLLTVVKRSKIRVLMLPVSRPDVNRLVEIFRREVYRNPDPFRYAGQALSQSLFRRLIGPMWSDLRGISRLIVVCDGPLHQLPLEVLETGFRPNDYLLRHAAISYAYSMQSVVEGRTVKPVQQPSVLSMAPFAVTETTLATIQQNGYEPLQGSEEEIKGKLGTHSIAGNASKKTFLALVPNHQLLHLATHAEANDTDPNESYIAFYPSEVSHRLYAHELGMLDLRHIRLTMLTGCRTGSGELHGGEGLLSLSRSFVMAGCPQVITSLWKAHNSTTTAITQLFYSELQQGKPTDIALQQAKLQFLDTQVKGETYSPPHFWAHLVLIGTPQPVYPPPSTWPVGWLAAIGVGLLVLIGYSQYRRQNSNK